MLFRSFSCSTTAEGWGVLRGIVMQMEAAEAARAQVTEDASCRAQLEKVQSWVGKAHLRSGRAMNPSQASIQRLYPPLGVRCAASSEAGHRKS